MNTNNAAKKLYFNGCSVVVGYWMEFPQTGEAVGRLVRKVIAKAGLDAERLHSQWCGPDWQAAEALDKEVRASVPG
jgi:hypothetical protein